MNAIEIRNLSKSFRGMYAVDHLNMTVPVGAIYGFLCDTGSEITETSIERRSLVKWLNLQGVNLTSVPQTVLSLVFVVVQHILVGAKCAVIAVLTLF